VCACALVKVHENECACARANTWRNSKRISTLIGYAFVETKRARARTLLSKSGTQIYVCCSVLQCVAVCCSDLQCAAVCCTVLHCVNEKSASAHASEQMWHTNMCVAECCSVLQ